MNKVCLLAPAGNLFKLKMAILYGADAVFIGGKTFSLRARASNFELEDIKEAVEFATKYGAKIMVTTNIIPHTSDLNGAKEYLIELDKLGVYAVIASSLYIIELVKSLNLKLKIHISTQTSVTNSLAVNFYNSLGADTIVLARELSIDKIATIKKNSKAKIEVFIHGGLCVSYSGRCTLSNNLAFRDANRGGCAHSCRWKYTLFEDGNQISETDNFLFGSKDLSTLSLLPQLLDTNVDILKIEGRMKSEHYIAIVVKTYRKAIDDYYQGTLTKSKLVQYLKELERSENRPYCSGFLQGYTNCDSHIFDSKSEQPNQEYLGYVESFDKESMLITIRQRNHFSLSDQLEIFFPVGDSVYISNYEVYDEFLNKTTEVNHPGKLIKIKVPVEVEVYSLIRKVRI